MLSNLITGFEVATLGTNLLVCLGGALIGTFIGVLPGLGPVATIAMLMPITFYLDPTAALIMLAGIYYGAQYGGSTTSILLNMPGESSSVVTCLDGYAMARKGRAGAAISVAALSSFVAGCIGTLIIASLSPVLARFALVFGPAEQFSLMLLGLVGAAFLASGSVMKSLAMLAVGLLLGFVGMDIHTGQQRFTFGQVEWMEGLPFVPVVMGLFGISEVIATAADPERRGAVIRTRFRELLPTRDELRRSAFPALRGTALGSIFGILPGTGAAISSFASYALEKRISRTPDQFGTGLVEGVSGPEAANNAAAQTSFIPLLTLGIPTGPVMALMLGALMIHGIQPGPMVMAERPELVWGLIASMWIGNLMLLVINLPMVGLWTRFLAVPYRILCPGILLFCCIGVYTVNGSFLDIGVMALFGIIGVLLRAYDFQAVPLILAFVLGPQLEENLRRALQLSDGNPATFLERPISLSLLTITVALAVTMMLPRLRKVVEQQESSS